MILRAVLILIACAAAVAGCGDCAVASYPHCPGPPGGAMCVDGKWICNPPDRLDLSATAPQDLAGVGDLRRASD